MRRFCCCLCLCWPLLSWADVEIRVADIYSSVLQLEQELDLLKQHFKVTGNNPAPLIDASLKPHHLWQKSYVIHLKANVFRRKHGLIQASPVVVQPSNKLGLAAVWEQFNRDITELKNIRYLLGVKGNTQAPATNENKQLIDVFNKLNHVAYEMDLLNQEPISPSDVYAEVTRLNDDINLIMNHLKVIDTAIPPPRLEQAKPADSLKAVFNLLKEIQRLQRFYDVETTDLSAFKKTEQIVPADVFNMVSMCLAELQLVKAKLGLSHVYTPPAAYQPQKTPTEVVQLLGYIHNKMRLIKSN